MATVERADLHAALGRLGERDRQLLELRYDEDLTQAAIASRLGIPEGTVKVRLHRARNKLRRAFVAPLSACTRGRAGRGEVRTAVQRRRGGPPPTI